MPCNAYEVELGSGPQIDHDSHWRCTRFTVAALAIAMVLALHSGIAHSEIYKWVDEQGNVHFGDKPKNSKSAAQAESVELRDSYTPTQRTVAEEAAYANERLATKRRLEARREAEEKRNSERLALENEQRLAQCAEDKALLKDVTQVQMTDTGPLMYYLTDENGNAMKVSEQNKAIAVLREKIARNC
ncbi:MAG: DUF4124 domain-containing protein [Halioglobus sp.]